MYNIVIKEKAVFERLSKEEKESTITMLKTIIDNNLLDIKYTFEDIKVEEVYDFDNQRNVSHLLKRQMFV